jgi:hypothetical protein
MSKHNRAEFTTVDIITERLNIRLLEKMRCGMDDGTDFEERLIGGVTKRCLVFPSCKVSGRQSRRQNIPLLVLILKTMQRAKRAL